MDANMDPETMAEVERGNNKLTNKMEKETEAEINW
jgi:hypothetical protein